MNCDSLPIELLTSAEMSRADDIAITRGIAGLTFMENAGSAVADEAAAMVPPGVTIAVLCGPGNNGGDGFVAARLLVERGNFVRLCLACDVGQLTGDAAEMARRWEGEILPFDATSLAGVDLIIDAIFGAGLKRPLEGSVRDMVEVVNHWAIAGMPVLAVDVPSGVDGTTGEVVGDLALLADRTVTFFRRKPGHLLLPAAHQCGEVVLADIGILDDVLDEMVSDGEPWPTCVNKSKLWIGRYPWPRVDGHKYDRGHVVAVSGPADATGAIRLAARGALRVGAGLVTVACARDALPIHAAQLNAIMVAQIDGPDGLRDQLGDKRRNAVVIGPGGGIGAPMREMVLNALGSPAAVLLDADALTSFEGRGDELFKAIKEKSGRLADGRDDCSVVLTPHDGEFKRLFGDSAGQGSKLERARKAARLSGAVVVLKGPDTVIAAPDGRAAINENGSPWLATAGSGDVLAGFIIGLQAQAMPAYEAACAGVWLHGECAMKSGPGLIAEDLPEQLPKVLQALLLLQVGVA